MYIHKKPLCKIIPDPNRILFENIEPHYLSDALGRLSHPADVLIFPLHQQEVSQIMRYAFENQIPVTPRGAGTNLVGSTVPIQGGIVLDLSQMNHILELDRATMTAVVEPGVLLQDFQTFVEAQGLFYPPDPGEKASTIGGNISTNAGGMRAVKYGVTRDYVRGLEVVLPNGKMATLGSKNVKDASGLSLKNLIIGAEGTLAVITKCILKLVPKPEASVSVLVPFQNLNTGIQCVFSILQSNLNPTAVEFVDRKAVQLGENFLHIAFPRPDAGSYLLLSFDGTPEQVEQNLQKTHQLVDNKGALDYIVLKDPVLAQNIWKVRGALVTAVEAISQQEPLDIVVPISQIVPFIHWVNQWEKTSGVQIVSFGHAGDGNVHLCVMRGAFNSPQWEEKLHLTMTHAYEKAAQLGGLPSGEHGIGISKQPYYHKSTPPENLFLMNQIKNALDPKHILNDQKSYIYSHTTV